MPTKTPLNDRICDYCRYGCCNHNKQQKKSNNLIMRFVDAFIGR